MLQDLFIFLLITTGILLCRCVLLLSNYSILIIINDEYFRYIFNVGEGTQRIAHENGVKIARLEHVFITYPVWENVGGLLGMALTVQECGVPELTIHGPEGIVSTVMKQDNNHEFLKD